MRSSTKLTAYLSGALLVFPNSVRGSSSLTIEYVIGGSPDTVNLVLVGVKGQEQATLDAYTGLVDAVRTVSLADTYDSFMLVPTWTGGQGVVIGAVLTIEGLGETFQGGFENVITGRGSPEGTVAAAVGGLYVDLDGTTNTVFYVKETGGSTSSGWAAK